MFKSKCAIAKQPVHSIQRVKEDINKLSCLKDATPKQQGWTAVTASMVGNMDGAVRKKCRAAMKSVLDDLFGELESEKGETAFDLTKKYLILENIRSTLLFIAEHPTLARKTKARGSLIKCEKQLGFLQAELSAKIAEQPEMRPVLRSAFINDWRKRLIILQQHLNFAIKLMVASASAGGGKASSNGQTLMAMRRQGSGLSGPQAAQVLQAETALVRMERQIKNLVAMCKNIKLGKSIFTGIETVFENDWVKKIPFATFGLSDGHAHGGGGAAAPVQPSEGATTAAQASRR
jgi:hypothetical protein